MDGKIQKLQIGIIYGDVIDLREHVEREIEKSRQDSQNTAGHLFHHEDRLSHIGQEIGKLEKKIEAMLKEKKPSLPKKPSLAAPPVSRISPEQAESLKELVHKKCSGNRKKIIALWSALNEAFGISRYKHLSESRFDEAVSWVRNYEIN